MNKKADKRKKRQEDTDDDHFGRHVAAVLKRLPNRAKAIARLKIEQVLMDVEFPEPHSLFTPYSNYLEQLLMIISFSTIFYIIITIIINYI